MYSYGGQEDSTPLLRASARQYSRAPATSFDDFDQPPDEVGYQTIVHEEELGQGQGHQEDPSKPEYEGIRLSSQAKLFESASSAGRMICVVFLVCILALLVVASTTSTAFRSSVSSVFSRIKQSYYNHRYGGDSGTDSVSEPDDDAYWDDYVAPVNTEEFELKRRGYASLPYWGYASSEVIKYQFLKKYDTLIEPYAYMHLVYNGHGDIDDGSGDFYTYSILDQKSGESVTQDEINYYYPVNTRESRDSTFNISCKPFDEFRIEVARYNVSSETAMYSFEWTAVCMYVRRELRSLTSGDLNATMNAMYAMWETDDDDGLAQWGENYHSATWFASLHDFNAGWADGDHIHEGLGFLPQHIKMTNLFETSMQAVDPSVSLFYWDFTLENTNEQTLFSSPMFAADTFGSLPSSSQHGEGSSKEWSWTYDNIADAYIPDGRWAGVKASLNTFEALASPYGYMRGPWNTNPGTGITRFSSDDLMSENLPSCKVYLTWLQDLDWNSFMQTSENAPHASLHGAVGGVYGCDCLDELYYMGLVGVDDSGIDFRSYICYKWPFYMKELYRADILTTKTNCKADEALTLNGTECGFMCNPDRVDDMEDVMQGLSLAKYVSNSSDPTLWAAISNFICNGSAYRIFSGDHLESASPADPSFWPIHPTQERLYQAKMFSGGFLESTSVWPNTTGSPSMGYTWVCNHADCYNYTDTSAGKDFYRSCCDGHFEDDQLFDFSTGDREQKYGLTNKQILSDTDPTSEDYAVTYIYDNFDWKHCAILTDYDINTEIEIMALNATTWTR